MYQPSQGLPHLLYIHLQGLHPRQGFKAVHVWSQVVFNKAEEYFSL